MKTVIKSIFLCLSLMMGFSSCDNKEELPPIGDRDNAETIAAGKYVGEWTRTNLSTGAVEEDAGSITFTVDEEHGYNVLIMAVESTSMELGVNGNTSACNISRLNSGEMVYWNMVDTNPFGMMFTGRISPEGVATMKYNKIVRTGRKEVEFSYTFSGNKE